MTIRINFPSWCSVDLQDVDGSSTSAAPLRPLFRTQSRIEVYTNPQSGKDHQDL
ncbi:hypothetical protein DPMN_112609 [Dreissena polymorpha]|uniref:Uncharacterized protein n=1 Tax=Dreissena polymorpha TaxID=45954 RepID=A0A9D4KGQ5_DREPO|nr:hypothetical protein DPMN_112609 [Dreissena polymorpha]